MRHSYPSGRKIQNAPNFFIGGADIPFAIPDDLDVGNLLKKIKGGIDFFQTQFAFDEIILKNYMNLI